MNEWASQVVPGILNHGEWVMFVLILANQGGVPVFAAPLLFGLGALAWGGDVNAAVALVIAVGAALCADLSWYGLGRWRGQWALSALSRLSYAAGVVVDDAERIFLVHDRAVQFAARFLPELNPLAAAFAGVVRVDLTRFVVGATASAVVWAGSWISAGYLLGGAVWGASGSGTPLLAVVVAVPVFASLSLMMVPGRRVVAALLNSGRNGVGIRRSVGHAS